MDSNQQTQIAEQTAQLGKKWEWIMIPGIIFVVFGIMTIGMPSTPITPTSMTGRALSLYFLISGCLRLIEAIGLKQYFDSERRYFLSILSFIVSALLFQLQNMQLFGIAVVLSIYFFSAAAAQLVRIVDLQKAPSWRWGFLSAGTTLALGVFVVYSFSPSQNFVPNDLIGLDLVATGISMIGFSWSINKFSAKYYSAAVTEPLRAESKKEEYRREPSPLRKREDSTTVSRDAH